MTNVHKKFTLCLLNVRLHLGIL